jgi:hypothetical protein
MVVTNLVKAVRTCCGPTGRGVFIKCYEISFQTDTSQAQDPKRLDAAKKS